MRFIILSFLTFFNISIFAQTNIQWNPQQFNNNVIFNALTATTVPYLDGSKIIQSSAVTPTELGFVHGTTSSLCGINQSCTYINKTIDGGSNSLTNLNASNLSSGTVGAARLPSPTASTLGGIESLAATTHQWINTISTSGVPSATQPAFSDISGTASLTTQVTGTLPFGNGGTGQASWTDGQLPIGNTATGGLTGATLTAGSNVTITNGNGSITIAATAASAPAYNYTAQTSNYSAAINDFVNVSGAAFTVTLPTAVGNSGKAVKVKKTDASLTNIIQIATTSAQTIDGNAASLYTLNTINEDWVFLSNGANWITDGHATLTPLTSFAYGITATSAYVFTWTGSQSIVIGDTYSDGLGHTFIVSATTNTTTGTFSGIAVPATTGTLTRVTGSGVTPIVWTSRTITGAPTKGGGSVIDSFLWRRNAQMFEYVWTYTQSTAGTAGSGLYLFGLLPSPLVVDSNVVTTTGASATLAVGTHLGQGIISTVAGGIANVSDQASLKAYSSNMFVIIDWDGAVRTGFLVGSAANPWSTANLQITLSGSIPVFGWLP